MRLSKNFSLKELIRSETATRKGINNNPNEDNSVFGLAVEFSQVVTQVRNIADTSIVTKGENAMKWMAVAQCFAGEAQDPPKPGTRKTAIK